MSVVTAGGLKRSRVDSLASPPPTTLLIFLTSFTPICQRGPSSGLLVHCEVSLSLSVTPHFISGLLAVWPSPHEPLSRLHYTPLDRRVHPVNAAVLCSGLV